MNVHRILLPGPPDPRIIRPKTAIPIHDEDDTAFKPPLEDFLAVAAAAGLGTQIPALARGESDAFTA